MKKCGKENKQNTDASCYTQKMMRMNKNMGNLDKTIRLVVAVVVIVLCLTRLVTGTLADILLIVAAVLIVTSLVGFCPLYVAFRINTAKKKQKGKTH